MSTSLPDESDRFGYALCGFGPAGCGFLLHAIKTGAIQRLADQGLVLIDRAAVPGAGKVGRYRLTGNSLSRAFLDCIDDPDLAWLFGDLRKYDPSVTELRRMEFEAPPLDLVGRFLTMMAKRAIDHVSSEYGLPTLFETDIEQISREVDGSYRLSLRQRRHGHRFTIDAGNVLSAFGGRQPAALVRACEMQPGVRLGAHTDRIMTSDGFLMMSDEAIRSAIPISSGGLGDVVIVGGSHSAMSAADRLAAALAPVGLRRITMLHNSPLRLYYASADAARADGYPFDDPDDICPMSGRINRFGGLRYRSFDVARSILDTGRMPDQPVEVLSVRLDESHIGSQRLVQAYLSDAPAVITCLGYQSNMPPMVDHQGGAITLCNGPRGLEIDSGGRVMAVGADRVSTEALPGLYAFGLGSELLKRSDAIGGEPSFRGQADGVWLYHNHGGQVVLGALLDDMPSAAEAGVFGGRRLSDARAFDEL
ncbi:MAG: hypothetical protein ACR2Q4_04165 [Geminicoccaceae bacterium]